MWIPILKGSEKEYFKSKLRELKRKKLSTITVTWFPPYDYQVKNKDSPTREGGVRSC